MKSGVHRRHLDTTSPTIPMPRPRHRETGCSEKKMRLSTGRQGYSERGDQDGRQPRDNFRMSRFDELPHHRLQRGVFSHAVACGHLSK